MGLCVIQLKENMMSWDKINVNANVTNQEYETLQNAAKQINAALSQIKAEDGRGGPDNGQRFSNPHVDGINDTNAKNVMANRIDRLPYINPDDIKMSDLSNLTKQISATRREYANNSAYNREPLSNIDRGHRIQLSGQPIAGSYVPLSSNDEKALFSLQVATEKLSKMSVDAARTEKSDIKSSDASFVNQNANAAATDAASDSVYNTLFE
jgi:hypothetical protein